MFDERGVAAIAEDARWRDVVEVQSFVVACLVVICDGSELLCLGHVPTSDDVTIYLEQRQWLSARVFVCDRLREEAHPHLSRTPAVGGSWVVICLHTILIFY